MSDSDIGFIFYLIFLVDILEEHILLSLFDIEHIGFVEGITECDVVGAGEY